MSGGFRGGGTGDEEIGGVEDEDYFCEGGGRGEGGDGFGEELGEGGEEGGFEGGSCSWGGWLGLGEVERAESVEEEKAGLLG